MKSNNFVVVLLFCIYSVKALGFEDNLDDCVKNMDSITLMMSFSKDNN